MSNIFKFLVLTFLITAPALAQSPIMTITRTPTFGLPIDCVVGQDCWVMNYVDYGVDDDKKTDLNCLARTYDGHKGTDFALLDGAAMVRGVDVLAAADGTVTRLRNSEKDGWHDKDELAAIRENRKECGNGIFIDHGDGVETVYCHLKLNSITVKKDQRVKKGDKIAQVGLSGMTEFPHLHFGIIKDNKIIDPFTGKNNQEECAIEIKESRMKPLWGKNIEMAYQPLIIQAAGFFNKAPDFEEIEREVPSLSSISLKEEALTFWVTILGARAGDNIKMEILDPNGKSFAVREIIQEKDRARQYYFIGKRITDEKTLEGAYTASVRIERDDKEWSKNSAILITQ